MKGFWPATCLALAALCLPTENARAEEAGPQGSAASQPSAASRPAEVAGAVGVVGGSALLVLGLYYFQKTQVLYDNLDTSRCLSKVCPSSTKSLVEQGKSEQRIALVFGLLGGGMVGTGLLLRSWSRRTQQGDVSMELRVQPSSLLLGGSF